MSEVILPFSQAGEIWRDDRGQSGVQVRASIHAWLVEQHISSSRVFISDRPYGKPIQIKFEFRNASDAMLFKLTWG